MGNDDQRVSLERTAVSRARTPCAVVDGENPGVSSYVSSTLRSRLHRRIACVDPSSAAMNVNRTYPIENIMVHSRLLASRRVGVCGSSRDLPVDANALCEVL